MPSEADTPPWLDSARLSLRRWQLGDLDAFCALTADPAVMRWVGDGSTLSRAQTALWIDKANANIARWGFGTHAVHECASQRIIGWAGLIRSSHTQGDSEAEIIYALAPTAWGQGYASELCQAIVSWAWAHSALEQILATLDPANLASQRVVEKCGFRHGGDHLDEDGLPESHYRLSRPGALRQR